MPIGLVVDKFYPPESQKPRIPSAAAWLPLCEPSIRTDRLRN